MSQLTDIPPERAMPETRMASREHSIVRYVAAAAPDRPGSRRLARYAVIAAGASAVLVGGTAAAYVALQPQPATVPVANEVHCYTQASLEGGDSFPGTILDQGGTGPGGSSDPLSAVESCASLWRNGMLQAGSGTLGEPDPAADHPVPPLAACRLDSGVAAVFPGDPGTCAELGLPQLAE